MGSQVVVLPTGCSLEMSELHDTHLGIPCIKTLARSYVWWLRMDAELESLVKTCTGCQQHQKDLAKSTLHLWEWPEHLWCQLHIHSGHWCFGIRTFLIIVDTHSKWLEVLKSKIISQATINLLHHVFTTHGHPNIIVSDNSPAFISEQFAAFIVRNEICCNNSLDCPLSRRRFTLSMIKHDNILQLTVLCGLSHFFCTHHASINELYWSMNNNNSSGLIIGLNILPSLVRCTCDCWLINQSYRIGSSTPYAVPPISLQHHDEDRETCFLGQLLVIKWFNTHISCSWNAGWLVLGL